MPNTKTKIEVLNKETYNDALTLWSHFRRLHTPD